MAYQSRNPITLEGKTLAVARVTGEEYQRFALQSEGREWDPGNLPVLRGQMVALGHHLRADETHWVRRLVAGSLAIELHEPDYVSEGVAASGKSVASKGFYEDFWGPQEQRHWKALKLCL